MISVLALLAAGLQSAVSLMPSHSALILQGKPDVVRGETTASGATAEVLRKGETAYEAEIKSPPSVRAVAKGTTLFVTFEARMLKSRTESQEASWSLRVQRTGPPYDGPFDNGGGVGREWRRFSAAFRADKDYEKGQLEVTFHIAGSIQQLQLRSFEWLDYGPSVDPARLPHTVISYLGREATAPWRKRARAMIEQYRKGDIRLRGRPNATVRVQMTRHAYPFGTFLDWATTHPADQEARYFKFVLDNFSRVTVPIYWADWGWESPEARLQYAKLYNWSKSANMPMKAHNVIWPSYQWSPTRLRSLTDQDLLSEIRKVTTQRLTTLKPEPFGNIDVVNELVTEHQFTDKFGLNFIEDIFRESRETWPKADLVYNDYMVRDGDGVDPRYLDYARRLKRSGAPITMLGYQAHIGESLPPITWVWKLLDTAKKEVDLPMEITEFDINTRDDQAQADYTRDILTAWFAHPQSRGFTMWGFWEASHWIPASAMIRRDWSERPSAKVWRKLTRETWWTDKTVTLSSKGTATVRGYFGSYQIGASGKTRAVSFASGSLSVDLDS